MFYHLNVSVVSYYAESEKRVAAKVCCRRMDILFSLHEPNYYALVQKRKIHLNDSKWAGTGQAQPLAPQSVAERCATSNVTYLFAKLL